MDQQLSQLFLMRLERPTWTMPAELDQIFLSTMSTVSHRDLGSVSPMTEPIVLIAGAGPTGLVLALWLTRLGVRVRIIDKTSEPGTTSRALAVQARTLEFYHQVGFDEA